MVEIITTQVSVTVGRFYFKHTVAKLKDRNIECAATKVEHGNFLVFIALVEAICQRCCSWLVHDSAHCQTGYLTGFFGGLALRVIEICRHGDNSLFHLLAEVILCRFFHFLKNHG